MAREFIDAVGAAWIQKCAVTASRHISHVISAGGVQDVARPPSSRIHSKKERTQSFTVLLMLIDAPRIA